MAYGKYVNMLIGLGSLHASLYCPTRWRRALRIMGKIDYGKRSIGASPDGLVIRHLCCPPTNIYLQSDAAKHLQPDLIEVKCPYSARDMRILDAVNTLQDFFLGMIIYENH